MSRAATLAALLLLAGCQTLPLPETLRPLSPDDPEVAGQLASWRDQAASRQGLRALARLSVDAPGAAEGGGDLNLRARQRLWLARPGRLRVEVLGLLDSAIAVLAVDGDRYALLQAPQRSVDRGEVYPGLLWDVARLDLTPEEAVALLLGAPGPEPGWALDGAARRGETLQLAFAGPAGRLRRLAEFGPAGELQRLEQRDERGNLMWEARYADFIEVDGVAFAHELALRSPAAEARVLLRRVELNPPLVEGLFEVAP